MNKKELEIAIQVTKQNIEEVKLQLEQAQNAKEIRKLGKRLKELQILQLWHLGQLENSSAVFY